MQLSDKIFRKKVEMLYPEIASEVVRIPILSDTSFIPELHRRFSDVVNSSVTTKGSELNELRALFIGVALKLYDPDYVDGFKSKVMNGLNDEFSQLFGIEKSTCSWWISQVVGRIRIYKEMGEAVQEIYAELKGSLNYEDIEGRAELND